MIRNKTMFASLMLILTTLLWGLSYSIQSISASELGTFTIVLFKGVGGLLLLPLLMFHRKKISRQDLIGGVSMGLFLFLGYVFQQLGIEHTSVSKVSFITALYIISVPLIEMFMGQKISGKIWISVLIAICGLYFLCVNGSSVINSGDLYALIGSLMFAVQIILIDRFSKACDPLTLTFVSQMTVSVLSLFVVLLRENIDLSVITRASAGIFFIIFIGGLLAECMQIRFQRDLDSSLSSLLMSFESVFGSLFGWILLHQVMSPKEIFGCILVFVAILLAESE